MSVFVFPSLFFKLEDAVCYTGMYYNYERQCNVHVLKIKIKVNDVIQMPKNKNTLMDVSSLI